MTMKIGNTLAKSTTIFDGEPFPSISLNKEVLTVLFPDDSFDIQEGKDEDDREIVVVDMPPKSHGVTVGNNIRCGIQNDRISVTFLFALHTIDELAEELPSIESVLDSIYVKLLDSYGLVEAQPDLYSRRWSGQSQAVPCLDWLKKQLSIDSCDVGFGDALEDGWILTDVRPVRFSLAIHTLPEVAKDSPEAIRRKMESLSKFEVGVGSAVDWNKGLGFLAAELRGMKPSIYINMLKAITAD